MVGSWDLSVCMCVLMGALVDASVVTFEILNKLTGFHETENVHRDIQADPQAIILALLN